MKKFVFSFAVALVLGCSLSAMGVEANFASMIPSHHHARVANRLHSISQERDYHLGRTSSFLEGSLHVVKIADQGHHHPERKLSSLMKDDPDMFKDAVKKAVRHILMDKFGYTGEETIVPVQEYVDQQGNIHIRLQQYVKGLEIEGTSMVVHINGSDGTVFALNGEFHANDLIDTPQDGEEILHCDVAIEMARKEYNISDDSQWESDCQEAAVQGLDGVAHLAYKRLLVHEQDGHHYRDLVFASRTTGALLDVHPGKAGDATHRSLQRSKPSFKTYDCKNLTDLVNCELVTDSSNPILTSDTAIEYAHAYAILVYNFFNDNLGRNSINGFGMTIKSLVHYGENANFSAGVNPTFYYLLYGGYVEGTSTPWSGGLDMVAWLYAVGVASYSSKLLWRFESGTLLAAFGDIMGAVVDKFVGGKKVHPVWRVCEHVRLAVYGGKKGIRDIANPPLFGYTDHYFDRFQYFRDHPELLDLVEIHTNVGIIDKVFYLMVRGGVHPRSKIEVTPLDPHFETSLFMGAQIFYNAYTACLTPTSDFYSARICTVMAAKGDQKETVEQAWEAVGIPKPNIQDLPHDVRLSGLSCGQSGNTRDQLFFKMAQRVPKGMNVTCKLEAPNGDPDLYVRFNERPEGFFSDQNQCYMATSYQKEYCTTGPSPKDGTEVYVTVQAWEDTSDMKLECYIDDGCKDKGAECRNNRDCCGYLVCDGEPGKKQTCKPCIDPCPDGPSIFSCQSKPCERNGQCCRTHPFCDVKGDKRCKTL